MTSRYAEGTTVPIEKSKAEIEATLRRYGADEFASGWSSKGGAVFFQADGRNVKLFIPAVQASDVETTEKGRTRRAGRLTSAVEAEERRRWRALLLLVKAKLEAVAMGVSTIEKEFLADIMLPNGDTLGDFIRPQLAESYRTNRLPSFSRMLEGPTPGFPPEKGTK